jgi:hypothetical protein
MPRLALLLSLAREEAPRCGPIGIALMGDKRTLTDW